VSRHKNGNTYITGPRTKPEDYPRDPKHQAAKFLQDKARDFLKEKSNAADVDEAVRVWMEAEPKPAPPSPSAPDGETGDELLASVIRLKNEIAAHRDQAERQRDEARKRADNAEREVARLQAEAGALRTEMVDIVHAECREFGVKRCKRKLWGGDNGWMQCDAARAALAADAGKDFAERLRLAEARGDSLLEGNLKLSEMLKASRDEADAADTLIEHLRMCATCAEGDYTECLKAKPIVAAWRAARDKGAK